MIKFIELDNIIGSGPTTRKVFVRVSDISMILEEKEYRGNRLGTGIVLTNGQNVNVKQTAEEIMGLMALDKPCIDAPTPTSNEKGISVEKPHEVSWWV